MSGRPYPRVTVTKKCERFLDGGHLWVYGGEIVGREPCENGAIADVYTENGKYLGSGFYNAHSKIAVRILSRNANDRYDDKKFFARRVDYAVRFRLAVLPPEDFACCRLIHGEADGIPGLTVDRYGPVLVSECLCLGTDLRKGEIYRALIDRLRACGEEIDVLYERSDQPVRKLEGMEDYTGFFAYDGLKSDTDGKVDVTENGVVYEVDYVHGQKTGFFLDQKYNRQSVRRLARGKNVLDCFTHTGSFALNAAMGGAASVTAVDISSDAVALAKANAARNGLNVDFITADVFDLLTDLKRAGKTPYDFIILDPPAFTKSGATVKSAFRGYKEINLKAMRLLPRGGFLATCSCSHFMTPELFEKMLDEAAHDADVRLKQIEARGAAPDHPYLRGVPETGYLKFYLFQVL